MMARHHAWLLVSVWDDPDWLALTAGAQRLYALLISQKRLTLCGHLDVTPRRWATLAADTTQADMEAALDELERARFIIVDHVTDELIIRTFTTHDMTASRLSAPVIKGYWHAWGDIASRTLRAQAVDNLPEDRWERLGSTAPAEAVEMRANPLVAPSAEGDAPPIREGDALPIREGEAVPFRVSLSTSLPLSSSRVDRAVQPAQRTPEEEEAPSNGSTPAPPPLAQRVGTALAILVDRDLDARQRREDLPGVHDPESWRSTAHAKRSQRHADDIVRLARDHPELTPEQLADRIEPVTSDPWRGRQAADMARAEDGSGRIRSLLAEPAPPPEVTEGGIAEARDALRRPRSEP